MTPEDSANAATMNCDALAPYYRSLEYVSFGSLLERTRFTYLDNTRGARRALLCGDGDGRFLARLLQASPDVEVDFVDLSARMIALAERRVGRLGSAYLRRVRFHEGDLRSFAPAGSEPYDLVTAHFFLDCFPEAEIAAVVERMAGWAAPGARWLVSEFRECSSAAARPVSRVLIRGLYAAFRVTTGLRTTRLPDYVGALANQNLRLRDEHFYLGGLLHASLWTGPVP